MLCVMACLGHRLGPLHPMQSMRVIFTNRICRSHPVQTCMPTSKASRGTRALLGQSANVKLAAPR